MFSLPLLWYHYLKKLSKKNSLIFSKRWFIFFFVVLIITSFLIIVTIGTIYWVLTNISVFNFRLDVLLIGYELRSWTTFLAYTNWFRLFLFFVANCYYFICVTICLITSIESKCHLIEYPEVWTIWTCITCLLFKHPVGNSLTLFFKCYDRLVLKNKNPILYSQLVWTLVSRLIISSATAVSWAYLEFIGYGILALWRDWDTPDQTFIRLYQQYTLNKVGLKDGVFIQEMFTTSYGTLETKPNFT